MVSRARLVIPDRDLHRVLVITRQVRVRMHRASWGLQGKCTLNIESSICSSIHNFARIYRLAFVGRGKKEREEDKEKEKKKEKENSVLSRSLLFERYSTR